MSLITKKVNRGVPPPLRTQNFSNSDAVQGDVLMVKDSLGHEATHCSIRCEDADMRLRFNCYHTVYPRIPEREGLVFGSFYPYLVSGQTYIDDSTAFLDVEAATTVTFDDEFAISDIYLMTVSGHFNIMVA